MFESKNSSKTTILNWIWKKSKTCFFNFSKMKKIQLFQNQKPVRTCFLDISFISINQLQNDIFEFISKKNGPKKYFSTFQDQKRLQKVLFWLHSNWKADSRRFFKLKFKNNPKTCFSFFSESKTTQKQFQINSVFTLKKIYFKG